MLPFFPKPVEVLLRNCINKPINSYGKQIRHYGKLSLFNIVWKREYSKIQENQDRHEQYNQMINQMIVNRWLYLMKYPYNWIQLN